MLKKFRLRKRSSTRRPAKWPYALALVMILSGAALYLTLWRNAPEPEKPAISISTWSRFSETGRLQMLLQGFAVKSMADVPCMDIDRVHLKDLGIERYLGISKERDVAGALQSQYGSSRSTFLDLDITVDILPKVDLILCWDYLCTLSEAEIRSTLLQFKRSGATFILMRHFPEVRKNEEKVSGVFQPINWKHHPYHFPEPMIHIMESGENGMESLALWNIRDLP